MMKYGIRASLPEGDPMRGEHLLGPDWGWEKWFASESERDAALAKMQSQFTYYRAGDIPTQVLKKVESEA